MPQISQLPMAGTLSGTEVVPVVQAGVTKKVPVSELRAPSTGLTITDGNNVVSDNAVEIAVTGNATVTGNGSLVTIDVESSPVQSVNGQTGAVNLNADDVGAAPVGHVGSGGSSHANATTTTAGFMSSSDKSKLNGIAAQATKNQTDAFLTNRVNHTGSQSMSTISGLEEALVLKASAQQPIFPWDGGNGSGMLLDVFVNSTPYIILADTSTDTILTVPFSDGSDPQKVFLAGGACSVVQMNTGKVIFQPEAGVTILKASNVSEMSTNSMGAYVTIKNIGLNTWVLYGDLTEQTFLEQLVANINDPTVVIQQSQIQP